MLAFPQIFPTVLKNRRKSYAQYVRTPKTHQGDQLMQRTHLKKMKFYTESECINPHPPTPLQYFKRSRWGLGHILSEKALPDWQQMDANGIFIYRVKLNWSCILMPNLHNQLCSVLMIYFQ